MSKADLVQLLNDKSNEFLLSKMLPISKGKNLEAILTDVVQKIYSWDKDHGIEALKALAIIIMIELRASPKASPLYCSETFLKVCLKEIPVENLDKVYPKIKGYLLEEAPIQSSSLKVVTRNPIISKFFFKILFDAEDSLLDETDIVLSIMHAALKEGTSFGPLRSFGQYLLINLPYNYIDINPEVGRILFSFAFQNNFISSRCLVWLKAELKAGNIGDYHIENSAKWICKLAAEKTSDEQIYIAWIALEREVGNIGDYHIENSAKWICKLAAEKTSDEQIYIAWIALEREVGNIGDYHIENSARWICKLAAEKTSSPHIYYAWIALEREADNIGDYHIENSARWICKLAAEKASYEQIYYAWIALEREAGNIGDYHIKNSARWICKTSYEKYKSSNILYQWTLTELRQKNYGNYKTVNSARWLCKEAFDKRTVKAEFNIKILSIWILLEYQADNIGDKHTPYSGQWLLFYFYEKMKVSDYKDYINN
ncbi:hypothetical protein [Spirosoma endbachense]|uniref:Uncharacterized protein n=1 Tax=Spirosoma endbachense TaxID=2666025 RepID=A0A6P1W0C2_9BACT|nr:hypothetical protein [Spirosoma endbachense]QHV97762.1 hypothetical protein GJR95_23355 [Spirosoma endbachense]